MNDFLSTLNSGKVLLADGAMGTMLHSRGIGFEKCFDELNLTQPAVVSGIHEEYLTAGADIILTNTFGANRFKLEKHGLINKLEQINHAGVEIARAAAVTANRPVFVAGDMGPLGVRLAPFGRVQPAQARAAFAAQVSALHSSGVDLIVIETIYDLYEIREGVRAVKEVCDLPVVASITFTRDDRTLLGDTPGKAARELADTGADIIGVNCSGGPAQLLRILKQMHQSVPNAKLWVKPNAGFPEQSGGRIMYPADPEYFGRYAQSFVSLGASVVGGCCGTTPAHIASMRRVLDSTTGTRIEVIPAESAELIEESPVESQTSSLARKLAAGKFVTTVEMDPPRGLSTNKLIAGASLLHEAGADVINVADSPLARMRMSAWAVCAILQQQAGIETTLHFPTRGRNLLRVQGDLLAAHALGIRNVFIVMGDPTSIGDYPEAADNFDILPTGLIQLIKEGFNTGLDHAGVSIGQPTRFFIGAAIQFAPADMETGISNVHRKVESGADFFISQPVFDPGEAQKFLKSYESEYGTLKQPVIVGLLPLFNARHAQYLNHEVPGIHIPEPIQARLDKAGEDGLQEGKRILLDLVRQVKPFAKGIYLMPQFNRYDIIAEILDEVQ